jgi:hypothetical protein
VPLKQFLDFCNCFCIKDKFENKSYPTLSGSSPWARPNPLQPSRWPGQAHRPPEAKASTAGRRRRRRPLALACVPRQARPPVPIKGEASRPARALAPPPRLCSAPRGVEPAPPELTPAAALLTTGASGRHRELQGAEPHVLRRSPSPAKHRNAATA